MNKSFKEFMNLSVDEFYKLTKDYTKTYNLLKICRTHGYYHFGYYVGKLLEKVDDWQFLDELAICAYWIGEYQESYNLCKRLLFMCPDIDKERITQNKTFSAKKLGIKEVFSLEQFKLDTKEEISKLNYKKYWYQFSEEAKLDVVKDLKATEVYFKNKLGYDIYPVYGTLLGIVRDSDFIGWDTDIDMAYLSKYHTNEEVLQEFNDLCTTLEKDSLLHYRIKTASHLHVWSPNKKLRIDLWISWIDTNGKYHIVWTVGGDIAGSMILPFKTVLFKQQILTQMNNPEQFLSAHYGNWTIPVGGGAGEWNKRPFVFELEPWHGK